MRIEYFESTEDLPIKRYQKFNKYLMLDSDVGSDFNAFNHRIANIKNFVDADLKQEALDEIVNFRQALFNGLNEISPSVNALVALIKTVDGKPFNYNSEKEVQRVIDYMDRSGFSKKDADNLTSEVKKNSIWNWLTTSLSTLKARLTKLRTTDY